MSKLLDQALAEVVKLPREEQDQIAQWLLDEFASEQRWSRAFAQSADRLAELADEAVAEHKRGRTRELDLDEK